MRLMTSRRPTKRWDSRASPAMGGISMDFRMSARTSRGASTTFAPRLTAASPRPAMLRCSSRLPTAFAYAASSGQTCCVCSLCSAAASETSAPRSGAARMPFHFSAVWKQRGVTASSPPADAASDAATLWSHRTKRLSLATRLADAVCLPVEIAPLPACRRGAPPTRSGGAFERHW